MKLTHALASGSLLSLGSAIEPRRVTRNLRHIQNESAKGENDVERLLFDAESMSMAATVGSNAVMGSAKSGKSQKKGDMDFFFVGHEECVDANFYRYESIAYVGIEDEDACQDKCRVFGGKDELIGLEYTPAAKWCLCLFDDGFVEDMVEKKGCPTEEGAAVCSTCPEGEGQVMGTEIGSVVLDGGPLCYRYGPPGLKPSSFTDFNEDGGVCLSSTGERYESIALNNIESAAEIEHSEGSPILSSPYPFDSPQGCAVECLKAGIVNFVGLNYHKVAMKVDPSCLDCTDPFDCDKCQIGPDGSLELVAHNCFCLLPDGAADCSGFPDDVFNFLVCSSLGDGTRPVAFALDKETYFTTSSGPGLTLTEASCIRNDNFDPAEPTLGAKFPGQHSKSGKVAKVFSNFGL